MSDRERNDFQSVGVFVPDAAKDLKTRQVQEALAVESTPKGKRAKAIAMKERSEGGIDVDLAMMLAGELDK